MANLTTEKLYTSYGPSDQFEAQMASGSFFKGALVGIDPVTGFYNNLEAGKPTLLAVGILRHTYDNTGKTERNVADPGVYQLAGTFVVATDQGLPVYAIDNQTVSTSHNGGTRPFVGIIVQVDSTTRARVKIKPSPAAMAIFTGSGDDQIHAPVANAAAMQAIVATDRADGMLCVDLGTLDIWRFDASSAVAADAWTRVPDAGTGRWIRTSASLTDLATAGSATLGANLIGLRDVGTIITATTVEGALQEIKTLVDAGMPVLKKTLTSDHTTLVAAAATETVNIGTALPANSRIVGVDFHTYTAFSGGTVGDFTVDIGTAGDVDALIDGADLFAAAVDSGPATIPQGIRPNKFFAAGGQLIATFRCGSDDVAGATAGAITIDVLYTVLA